MKFISLCSGIEAASVAWKPLGWTPVVYSEVDKFCNALLAYRHPETTNVGDMTKVDWASYRGKADVVIGGFPCQAFSVAGLRNSLDDDRGNLSLEFVRALHATRPIWFVAENVPGWLNTKDNAFGCFLAGVTGADAPLLPTDEGGGWPSAGVAAGPAYGVAWRTVDAQYHGLPQRRRRVFVVGYLGDWKPAAQVLFESGPVPRNPPSRRAPGQEPARCLTSSTGGCSAKDGQNFLGPEHLNPAFGADGPSRCLDAPNTASGRLNETQADFVGQPIPLHEVTGQRGEARERDGQNFGQPGDPTHALQAKQQHGVAQAMPFDTNQITHRDNRSNPQPGDPSPSLSAEGLPPAVISFGSNDHGGDALEDCSPTLRAGGHKDSHQNGGVAPAVCYGLRTEASGANGTPVSEEVSKTLDTGSPPAVVHGPSERLLVCGRCGEQFMSKDDIGGLAPAECDPCGEEDNLREADASEVQAFQARHYTRDKGGGAPSDVSPTLGAESDRGDSQPLVFESRFARNGRGAPEEICPPLKAQSGETGKGDSAPIVFQERGREGGQNLEVGGDVANALTSPSGGGRRNEMNLAVNMVVRRLTPRECERLQGFPDNYTFIPGYRAKLRAHDLEEMAAYLGVPLDEARELGVTPDGPRYKALGNSMATDVIEWIGVRIQAVAAALRNG